MASARRGRKKITIALTTISMIVIIIITIIITIVIIIIILLITVVIVIFITIIIIKHIDTMWMLISLAVPADPLNSARGNNF